MNSKDLFGADIGSVTEALNKNRWNPFLSKARVLRIFGNLANKLTDTYRKKRQEDSQKVLDRMNELDKLYKEREEERERQFVSFMELQKKALLDASSKAFCHGVCKERASMDDNVICTCQRRCRYVNNLEKGFDAYMAENSQKLLTDFKNSPKWKEQSKE